MQVSHAVSRLFILTTITLAALCGCSKGPDPQSYIKDLDTSDKTAGEQEVRAKAVDELARMGETALPAVKELLKNDSSTPLGVLRLKGAIDVLSKIKKGESLEEVGTKINDPNPEVRLAAIEGVSKLAEVRKSLSIDLLKRGLKDGDPKVVRAAAMGLYRLGSKDANAVLAEALARGQGMEAMFAGEALFTLDRRVAASKFILDGLSSSDAQTRETAMTIAANLGDKFIDPLLRYRQEHANAKDVETTLAKIRDQLFDEFKQTLTPRRAREVMAALGKIADDASVKWLLDVVNDGKRDVASRMAAAEALGDAATSSRPAGAQAETRDRIKTNLEAILDKGNNADNRVKIACAISLCRLKERTGMDYLLEQLRILEKQTGAVMAEATPSAEAKAKPVTKAETDALTELRIRAQEALTSSGEFVVPYLLKAIQEPGAGDVTYWASAKTFGALKVKEAVAPLTALLAATGSEEAVRARLGDPDPKLTIQTKSNKAVVVMATREAVFTGAVGSVDSVPTRSSYVRMAAGEALGQIGTPEATKALKDAVAIHEKVLGKLQTYLQQQGFSDLIPSDATNEAERLNARKTFTELTQRLIAEQEAVLFYCRLALRDLGEKA